MRCSMLFGYKGKKHFFYKNALNLAEPKDVLILAHTFS